MQKSIGHKPVSNQTRPTHALATLMTLFTLALPSITRAQTDNLACTDYTSIESSANALINAYENQLGLFKDPFAFSFTKREADSAFKGLLTRSNGMFCEDTPLFKIQSELNRHAANYKNPINRPLLEEIIEDAAITLVSSSQTDNEPQDLMNPFPPTQASIIDLQSNLLALKGVLDYVHRFVACQSAKNSSGTQDDSGEKAKQSQEKKEKSEDQPEKYPELGDEYKPHTKELGSQPGEQSDEKKKTVVAEVNFKTHLFGQKIYANIMRGNQSPLQTSSRLRGIKELTGQTSARDAVKNMVVRPLGENKVTLFLPSGHIPAPFNSPHAHIQADGAGAYNLIFDEPVESITIPLAERAPQELTQLEEDVFTQRVGFDVNEWPETVQTAIISKYPAATTDAQTIAKAVAAHISKKYLYSKKAKPETDPVQALQAGAFQCDMAAYTMTSILRDVYHVPSRVVGGFPAKQFQGGKNKKSYLVLPADGHAWVEVFHDGAWHVYDPTPKRKEKDADKEEKEKSDYSDVPSDKQEEQDQDDQDTDESRESQDSQESTDKSTDKPKDKDAGASDDAKKPEDESADESAADKKAEDTEKTDDANEQKDVEPFFLPELEDALAELLQFDQLKDDNKLKKYILELVLMELLNPLKNSEEAANRLNMAKRVFEHNAQMKTMIFEALQLHKNPHDGMVEWFGTIEKHIFDQDINTTYKDLLRMIKLFALNQKVTDSPEIKQLTDTVRAKLLHVLEILQVLKDPSAAAMALVDDFKKSSPSLLWKLMQKDYDIQDVGPNIQTTNLANDIKAGKHNDNLLINYLYGHTNFILNSAPKPGSSWVKTWLRDAKPGRDIVPTQQINDWRRTIPTNARFNRIENIARGTAYVLTNRIKVAVPTAKDNKEAERITIVGYDVSGSMGGTPAEFQASLIAAFVARALSDVSPSGHHRHRVVLVPFDHEVGTPQKINTVQEALDLIRNHQRTLAKAEGGTDIQKFLLQAMALIAEAQNRKSPFDIANIILMSDGGSAVDYAELKKAREAINRNTPVQTMFIGIGGSNPELQQFAQDSAKMGAEKGLYKEFSGYDMDKMMSDGRKIDTKKYEKYFYSAKDAREIPHEAHKHLSAAYTQVKNALAPAIRTRLAAEAYEHLHEKLGQTKDKTESYIKRPVEAWINDVRIMLTHHKLFHHKQLLNFILQNIITRFEDLTGVPLQELSHGEHEQMVHLLNNPTGAQE